MMTTSTTSSARRNVAIVGAGYIASYHLQCLARLDAVDVIAICDLDSASAAALQDRWGIPHRYSNIETMLEAHRLDIVHIVTPPSTHADLAERCLRTGVSVFLEKPMALSAAEADRLKELSGPDGRAMLGTNHNAVFFPAFRRLSADIDAGHIGKVEHVGIVVNTPMRQLETNQFGHWAFRRPGNLAFESLYHPLTQIHDLVGATVDMKVMTTGARELAPGRVIFDTWSINLVCERGTAQLQFSCAKALPTYGVWVFGQEAIAQLDVLNNGYRRQGRTQHAWFLDSAIWHLRNARSSIADAARNLTGFVLATLRLARPNDPFTSSIEASIGDFYKAHAARTPSRGNAEAGAVVVATCEQLGTLADAHARPLATSPKNSRKTSTQQASDDSKILIIGANGFIGQHLTNRLIKRGRTVRILVHNPDRVPAVLIDPRIQIVRGDVMDVDSLQMAMKGTHFVYHLAGTAKDTWAESYALLVEGTNNVASTCLSSGVKRLIYTSTIAAYYLGGRNLITEDSPLDSHATGRSHYARGKIESEWALREFERTHSLELVICRPGVVVGPGGRPMHSAVGTWPNPSHVVGWGLGTHPMPLVLVQDCADALARLVEVERLESRSFNLVGDVRLTPREYTSALAIATGRRVHFHASPLLLTYAADLIKWLIKLATRRPGTVFPNWRDLATRSQRAQFDTTKTKRVLQWEPETNAQAFIKKGIQCVDEPLDQPSTEHAHRLEQ